MNKEEKEAIENHFKNALDNLIIDIQGIPASEIVCREQSMVLFYKRVMLEIEKRDNLISKLQKENEKLKFKLLARERGEAEFEVLVDTLKKENEELEKTIDLIIDDFQAEGYFKEMTYEQVKKYYDNRNELNQEINILPLNLDLTSE